MTPSQQAVADAFRTALNLFETGVALMRQNLRRLHPTATESELDDRLTEWLHHRPGAELGDAAEGSPARRTQR